MREEKKRSMKKAILITWLLICLLPLAVKAGEPVQAPAEEMVILAGSPKKEFLNAGYLIPSPGWRNGIIRRLSDDELDSISAKGIKPNKDVHSATHADRIILWDEAGSLASSGRTHLINRVSITE
jgi:hypothetical protein